MQIQKARRSGEGEIGRVDPVNAVARRTEFSPLFKCAAAVEAERGDGVVECPANRN